MTGDRPSETLVSRAERRAQGRARGNREHESGPHEGLAFQGWASLAFWISVGLLLETLLAYKAPAYLGDLQRRELFRLAHAHGTLLGVVLVLTAVWARGRAASLSRPALLALRAGSVSMPLGFLLAGIWHPEGDPGWAIWLVPGAALLLIFALASIVFSNRS